MSIPKPTDLLSPIADTESALKNQIESTTGLALPPGPIEMFRSVMQQLEDAIPGLPSLENLGFQVSNKNLSTGSASSAVAQSAGEVSYSAKKTKVSTSRKLLW